MTLGLIENDIANTVTRAFESPDLIHYPYHNLSHTQSVVIHAKEIAAYYLLNETDTFIISTAAWFHDIGQIYGEMEGHEERGVLIMQYYLQSLSQEYISAISDCILATRFPSHPVTLREQILCDADTYHIETSLFRRTDPLVEKEMEMRTGKKNPHWLRDTLKFLQQHVFYTEYCKKMLGAGKLENIEWLESQIY